MADNKKVTTETVKENATEVLQQNEYVQGFVGFFNKYKPYFLGAVAGVLIFVLYKQFFNKPKDATKELKSEAAYFSAAQYMKQDSFDVALNGNQNGAGLLSIIKTTKGTSTADQAMLNAAFCYLKTNRPKEALKLLEDAGGFGKNINARRLSLIGDAKSELATQNGKTDIKGCQDAIDAYEKAVSQFPKDDYNAVYLEKVGILYEKMGKPADAIKAYQKIKANYPEYMQINEVDKSLGRLGVEN